MKWLDDVMPDNERWQQWRGSLMQLRDNVKDNIEIGVFEVFLYYYCDYKIFINIIVVYIKILDSRL